MTISYRANAGRPDLFANAQDIEAAQRVRPSANYMVAHRSLNLAILEIAFNALGPDGRPWTATMPLEVHSSAFEQFLRDAQASGELREFDVEVMAGLLRSAVTHTMVMAIRADPGVDLAAYARELGTTFDLATRPDDN